MTKTTLDTHEYPSFASAKGECKKCGAPEFKHEGTVNYSGIGGITTVLARSRKYVAAEPERREFKPVYVGEQGPSYTGQPMRQPDRYDEIVHPAKPERIHHTCQVCGHVLSTRCNDS